MNTPSFYHVSKHFRVLHGLSVLLVLLFLLIVPALTQCRAETPQPSFIDNNPGPSTLFAEAGKAYDQGDLQRAVSLYNELLNQGFTSPQVYFNLGNAYFRKGESGLAILNFKRTLQENPRDADAKANLRYALESSGALTLQTGLFHRLLSTLNINEWTRLLIVFWWLSALAIFLFWAKPGWTLFTRRIILLLCVAPLLISACGVWVQRNLQLCPEAVVIEPNQQALSAPLKGSTILFKLPEGSVVRKIGVSGEWYHIKADKESGWIRRASCVTVPL